MLLSLEIAATLLLLGAQVIAAYERIGTKSQTLDFDYISPVRQGLEYKYQKKNNQQEQSAANVHFPLLRVNHALRGARARNIFEHTQPARSVRWHTNGHRLMPTG
jgi:hypothetical protein